MNATKWIMATAFVALAVSAAAADDSAEGDAGIKEATLLCNAPGETAELACRSRDDRLVAVCTNPGGSLRLAFQAIGKLESRIVLPKDPGDLRSVETGWLIYSGGGGSYVCFKTGEVDYVAYSAIGKGWRQAGLSEVDGRRAPGEDGEVPHLDEHTCLPASTGHDAGFPSLAERAGYRVEESPSFDIAVQERGKPAPRRRRPR